MEVVNCCSIDGPNVARVEFRSIFAHSEPTLIKLKLRAKKNGMIVKKCMPIARW